MSMATRPVACAADVSTSAGRKVGREGIKPSVSLSAPGSLTEHPACITLRMLLWPLVDSPGAQHRA
eukprot:1123393-Karenia_brevis.AAC.1